MVIESKFREKGRINVTKNAGDHVFESEIQ